MKTSDSRLIAVVAANYHPGVNAMVETCKTLIERDSECQYVVALVQGAWELPLAVAHHCQRPETSAVIALLALAEHLIQAHMTFSHEEIQAARKHLGNERSDEEVAAILAHLTWLVNSVFKQVLDERAQELVDADAALRQSRRRPRPGE